MAAILGQGRPGDLLLAWIVVVFVSILAHELGHAFAFRAFDDDARITLHAFGGLTHATKALPTGQGLVASAAGPLVGLLVLGLPAYAIQELVDPTTLGRLATVVLADLVWVNVGWSLLNLLPILPLDGGRIAERVLGHVLGPSGTAAALLLSIATATTGAILAAANDDPFLALYAGLFAVGDVWELWKRRDEPNRVRLREARNLIGSDRRRAEELLRQTVSYARTREVRAEAATALAWVLVEDRRTREARALVDGPASVHANAAGIRGVLEALDGRPGPGSELIATWWLAHPAYALGTEITGSLADAGAIDRILDQVMAAEGEDPAVLGLRLQYELHVAERYERSAEVGRRLFEDGRAPRAGVAFNIACSLCRMGRLGRALDWLDIAVASGWSDATAIAEDDDLAPLRTLPRYTMITSRIR
jgi:Zn-dependent protease